MMDMLARPCLSPRARLTPSALETLQRIAEKPRRTTKYQHLDYVSGRSAACLVARGLARYVYDKPYIPGEPISLDRTVQITDDGKAVLRQNEGREK